MSTKVTMQIFRHDFGEKFMEELEQFAIIHKYDDRKVFKDAWNKWTEQDSIQSLIHQEINQLQSSGYKGDVLDKMFKSARYYYRKKEEKVEEKPRKKYVSLSAHFLEQIDNYIMNVRNASANLLPANVSPANLYEEFCKTHKTLISQEITQLLDLSREEICIKIKKTFKNRIYVLIAKNKDQ